jgi:hypothetical protein
VGGNAALGPVKQCPFQKRFNVFLGLGWGDAKLKSHVIIRGQHPAAACRYAKEVYPNLEKLVWKLLNLGIINNFGVHAEPCVGAGH